MTLALHQYLQDLASHADLHGVLGVYADGAAVAEQACGHANLAGGRKNAPDTRFRIGSLSKSHTAAAILLLAQHGKLDLHDSAARHLPDCGLDPRITPMHLLRHRSGLGNHTALPAYWPELMGRHIAPEDLIRLITASPLMDTPGQACRYSNTGYAVLARIAERVGGDALHDQLRTMFWQALELRETGSIDTAHSIGCMLDPDRPPAPPLHPSVAFGAYDLAASARDLARWWLSLIDGKVLDAAHTDLMLGGRAATSVAAGGWTRSRSTAGAGAASRTRATSMAIHPCCWACRNAGCAPSCCSTPPRRRPARRRDACWGWPWARPGLPIPPP